MCRCYLYNCFIITFQIIELINVSNKNNSARSNYSSSNVRMIKVGALTLQFWLFMLLTFSFSWLLWHLFPHFLCCFYSLVRRKSFSRIYTLPFVHNSSRRAYYTFFLKKGEKIMVNWNWKGKDNRQYGVDIKHIFWNLSYYRNINPH